MPSSVAQAAVDRALYEAWLGRETLEAALPLSWLRLDPGDTIRFAPLGEDYRLAAIAEAEALGLRGTRTEAGLYVAPSPAPRRPMPPPAPDTEADAIVVFLDGPMLRDDDAAHRGHVGAAMIPWGAGVALYRSPATSGYALTNALTTPAVIGETTADFYSGPLWRWDRVNHLYLEIERGTLASATEAAVLNGANALAIENADGEWEILQFATRPSTARSTTSCPTCSAASGAASTPCGARSPPGRG